MYFQYLSLPHYCDTVFMIDRAIRGLLCNSPGLQENVSSPHDMISHITHRISRMLLQHMHNNYGHMSDDFLYYEMSCFANHKLYEYENHMVYRSIKYIPNYFTTC